MTFSADMYDLLDVPIIFRLFFRMTPNFKHFVLGMKVSTCELIFEDVASSRE